MVPHRSADHQLFFLIAPPSTTTTTSYLNAELLRKEQSIQAMASAHTDSSSAHSAPPSPATTMSAQTDAAHPAVDNSLDDIFGSSPETEARSELRASQPTNEPSDLPSLRRQHVTAGYRDGVATSKGQNVQEGFDAGFPVGAQLGMRAGTILGILEGITRGVEDRSVVKKPARGTKEESGAELESRRATREQVLKLYTDAVSSLDVQAVFTGDTETESGEAGETAEAQLGRKGDRVVSKWEARVAVPGWEENMEALEMKEKAEKESQGEQGAGERS